MQNSTLFLLDHEPSKPDATRREPVIWLKRLVLLSSLNSASTIRDISFRRGLNIVQTRQMKQQGGPVAGHSVGKTLLMRLIRYTLGESSFGTDDTQQAIAKALASSYVVAVWAVCGIDWVVVRPVGDIEKESFAAANSTWQEVVDSPKGATSVREFTQTVHAAVLANLPPLTLPRREARWLDVLAWLSRDYQCGYRKANDWRHEDANSGPSLDREDNSIVMQWIMGMMGTEEIDLRVKHHAKLNQQAVEKRTHEREQKKLEFAAPLLSEKLGLEEIPVAEDGQSTFDSVEPTKVVARQIEAFQKLRAERIQEANLGAIEEQLEDFQHKSREAAAELKRREGMVEWLTKQIKEYETDPARAFANCKAKPTCWMREHAMEVAADPAAKDHLSELKENLTQEEEFKAAAERNKTKAQDGLTQVKAKLESARSKLSDELSGIDEEIGKWKGYQPDTVDFETTVKTASKITRKLRSIEGEIKTSLKLQEDERAKHHRRVKSLTAVYQDILQRIFGAEAKGKILVDGNGLQPVPDKKLSPAGAALSVMTTVLAFDLACAAGSICGIGSHPRFLMHDSPREGDMEGPLFRRLFEVAANLEAEFDDPESVSYQYIVTTTSMPPETLASEAGPYVRLTLDAQRDDGLLLRRRF